jgi:hypothetical protein
MTLAAITAIVAVCTALVGVATFIQSVLEYIKEGSTKRAEQFLLMRLRLRENADSVAICEMLESKDNRLCDVPLLKKDNFIGFFEELYLLWNSRVFNDEVVFYMFGYFALLCWRNDNFWFGLNSSTKALGIAVLGRQVLSDRI